MIKTLALNGKALLTNNKELGWDSSLSAIYWNNPEAITAAGGNSTTMTIDTEITGFNYCAVKFQQQGNIATYWAHDFWLNFNNYTWPVRTHYGPGNYKGVINTETNPWPGFYTATSDVKYSPQDGRIIWYYRNIPETDNATYKFVLDRGTSVCSAFLDNTYLGYKNVSAGITALNSIQIASEVIGTVTTKEHYVAGFKNLSDAVAW